MSQTYSLDPASLQYDPGYAQAYRHATCPPRGMGGMGPDCGHVLRLWRDQHAVAAGMRDGEIAAGIDPDRFATPPAESPREVEVAHERGPRIEVARRRAAVLAVAEAAASADDDEGIGNV